jgi:hypothetical protein
MKTQKSIHSHALRRIVLIVPVIASMALVACSDVAGTGGTHANVNLQSAATGGPRTADNVTIGRRTYDPETKSFDRPWPFGPEGGAQ